MTVLCEHCGIRRPRQFTTDGYGRDVEITPDCKHIVSTRIPKDADEPQLDITRFGNLRHTSRSGICKLCDAPISKLRTYCDTHQRQAAVEKFARYSAKKRAKQYSMFAEVA